MREPTGLQTFALYFGMRWVAALTPVIAAVLLLPNGVGASEDLASAWYRCESYADVPAGTDIGAYWQRAFKLTDGEAHEAPPCDGCVAHASVTLVKVYPGEGGRRVALVADSGGGSGVAMYAFVFQGGRCEFAVPLGDRVRVTSVSTDRNELTVDLLTHGPTDGSCCPTLAKTLSFELPGGERAEAGETTTDPLSDFMERHPILTGWIIAAALWTAYFFPADRASVRRHHHADAIFVLNLLLGWTALGWIGALVWAYTARPSTPTSEPPSASLFESFTRAVVAIACSIQVYVLVTDGEPWGPWKIAGVVVAGLFAILVVFAFVMSRLESARGQS